MVLEVNLHCAACVRSAGRVLADLEVEGAEVSLESKTVTLPASAASRRDAVIEALRKRGYTVTVRE